MKYFIVVLSLFLFSCSTYQIARSSSDSSESLIELHNQAKSRQLAAEQGNVSEEVYTKYFAAENYLNRLIKIEKYSRQLYNVMESKGHPRKRIMQQFRNDLAQQIVELKNLESGQQNLGLSWLPQVDSPEYRRKIQALRIVTESAKVMQQLENYLDATKVMEENSDNQNIYYRYLSRALRDLATELDEREGKNKEATQQAQLSYAEHLSTEARLNLHKVFTLKNKSTKKKVDQFLEKLQQARSVSQAQALLSSTEMDRSRSYLAYQEIPESSDIEGVRDVFDAKISTYYGLEMIKFLYSHLN